MKKESEPSSQPKEEKFIDGELVEMPEKKNVHPVMSGLGNFDIQTSLSQAISQGNVEIAERVMAMYRELKAEWAKEQFDKAMSKFQGECPVIEKTKKVYEKDGRTLRYKFAPLDSIVAQTKKAIAKNGLSYTIKTTNGEKSLTSTVRVTHLAGHSEENSFSVPIGEEMYMSQVQKYGARSTFAKRYAYCDAFGIMTGDEDNDAVEEKEPKQSAKPAQKPTPAQQAPQPPKNTALIKVKKKLHDLGAGTETEAVELLQEMTGIKWPNLKATEKMAELALEALKKKEAGDKSKEFKKEPKEGDICNVDGKIGTLVRDKDGKLFCLIEDAIDNNIIKKEKEDFNKRQEEAIAAKATESVPRNEQKEKWPFPPAKIKVLLGLIKSKKGIEDEKEAIRYINACIKHPAFPDSTINAMEDMNMDEGDRLIKFMMTAFTDENRGK